MARMRQIGSFSFEYVTHHTMAKNERINCSIHVILIYPIRWRLGYLKAWQNIKYEYLRNTIAL